MVSNGNEWKLDEMRTLAAMLRVLILRLDRLTRQDKSEWVSRREYQRVVGQIITCLERQCEQSERMLGCVDTLTAAVDKLTSVVIELQKRADGEP